VAGTLIHASCVAIDGAAVLLCGPSGSGKSDLALRLIDGGAELVADDQVTLTAEDGRLIARAPATLAGLLEVRGIGIVPFDALDSAPVALVVDLAPAEAVERMPEADYCELAGLSVRRLTLNAFEASAAAKVRVGLREAGRQAARPG
jgi:serine kinase of HPr protein (carbohydrate metabolism regulator)